MKHHIKCENVWTNNAVQQLNIGRCQMFKMSTSGHNACPRSKSARMHRLINDRLSVNQTLPQLINISHRMLTYTHSYSIVKILSSTVGYVKKPCLCHDEVRHLAAKKLDGCAHSHALLACCSVET